VKQLFEDGIIVKSDFAWNSPLLIVPKRWAQTGKNGAWWSIFANGMRIMLGMLTPYLTSLKYCNGFSLTGGGVV